MLAKSLGQETRRPWRGNSWRLPQADGFLFSSSRFLTSFSFISCCSVVVVFIFNYSFLHLLDFPVGCVDRKAGRVCIVQTFGTFMFFSAALIRGCRDSTTRSLPRSNCCFLFSWLLIFRGCRSRDIFFLFSSLRPFRSLNFILLSLIDQLLLVQRDLNRPIPNQR